jgi:hypothetical protein
MVPSLRRQKGGSYALEDCGRDRIASRIRCPGRQGEGGVAPRSRGDTLSLSNGSKGGALSTDSAKVSRFEGKKHEFKTAATATSILMERSAHE